MMNNIIFEFFIPFGYLLLVIIFKQRFLDKKYDSHKSSVIYDILNCLVILYFLFFKDMVMTLMFSFYMMTRYNSYKKNNSAKIIKKK
jgi:hypothetical protein